MKKLLLIQLDEAFFLFETLQMLERHRDGIRDFELTLLCDPKAFAQLQDGSAPPFPGITTDIQKVLSGSYDVSVNLSMTDESWTLHHQIQSAKKLGPYLKDGQLWVDDLWSTYLLTLKSKAPFLTFHMQDIYKNILGFRKIPQTKIERTNFRYLVFGLCRPELFPALEQEKLLTTITQHHSNIQVIDITEVDLVSDLSEVLYVGPTCIQALKICEAGARGIFLGTYFQGLNLLPHEEGHYYLSTRGQRFSSNQLIPFLDQFLLGGEMPKQIPYSIYVTDQENIYGSYLKSLNASDDNYPVYQAHVVLWNFVLNLFDTNLEVTSCSEGQLALLKGQKDVLKKIIRLYDYTMSSIDTIHREAKAIKADFDKIEGHLRNLREMEEITDKISQTNSFLRPILDFYRIRRGQNRGSLLMEQAQHTFLTYSEEQHALKALLELFSVTLEKNEVNI